MKKILPLITFILGLLVSGIVATAAYVMSSRSISFQPNTSSWKVDNVEDALNSLKDDAVFDSCKRVSPPKIKDGLVPVKMNDDGTMVMANKNNNDWYDYCNKVWANAVILNENVTKNVGDPIVDSEVESYFVWIPKYKYKLWNVDTTNPDKTAHSIEIIFDTNDTSDVEGVSCKTPMQAATKGNCDNGEYMTHPAFVSMNTTGIWLGKFELTGSINKLTTKPNQVALLNNTVYQFFTAIYNYKEDLGSHMMKNTEWGAVSYLSQSKYGIDREVNVNNNSAFITGKSALPTVITDIYPSDSSYGNSNSYNLSYNTKVGYLASTTGNISGIYDMSGGAHEYVAAHIQNQYTSNSGFDAAKEAMYDAKYFDIYPSNTSQTNYGNRILGDATGEMGPFITYKEYNNYNYNLSKWYGDSAYCPTNTYPWFERGSRYIGARIAGQFEFGYVNGGGYDNRTTRMALAF